MATVSSLWDREIIFTSEQFDVVFPSAEESSFPKNRKLPTFLRVESKV